MKLNRRSALAGVAALSATPGAFAQAFPDKLIESTIALDQVDQGRCDRAGVTP